MRAGASTGAREREEARAAAYLEIERVQADDGDLGRLRDLIESPWPDVGCLAAFALAIHHRIAGESAAQALAIMAERAEESGDEALRALALVICTELADADADEAADERRESDLARAMAVVEAGAGERMFRRTAQLAGAVAYYDRGLWELADEIYERAWEELADVAPDADPGVACDVRAIAFNRLEVAAVLVCELVEAGERSEARAVAARGLLRARDVPASLPPSWRSHLAAMRSILLAVAGRPPEDVPLDDPALGAYRAFHELGSAIRAFDAGDLAAAAEIAAGVRDAMGRPGVLPGADLLALRIMASSTVEHAPTARYVTEAVRRRRAERAAATRAARARVASARLAAEHADLARRVYVDDLTGIANRTGYARLVERLRADAEGTGVAVLLVDVDRFKDVNDTFGHRVGDLVLQQVAALLVGCTRPGDLVARLGGDEFVVVVLGGGIAHAGARAADVVRAVRARAWHELAPGLDVSASVGWAVGRGSAIEAVFEEADRGLYGAKRAGRGRAANTDAAETSPA